MFLYVHHLGRALGAGVYTDVAALPEGDRFYPAYLARLRERVGAGLYETVYLPALLLLCATYQPVSTHDTTMIAAPIGQPIEVVAPSPIGAPRSLGAKATTIMKP